MSTTYACAACSRRTELPSVAHPRLAQQGAFITQCVPSYYYAVHETGHRLGFRHANMYRLAEGRGRQAPAPTDPLGPGETTAAGYRCAVGLRVG